MQTASRQSRGIETREKLIEAAVSLYGRRSIDAVSFREIGTAAGQKNPNALQYHFGDRDGLLQAIVDAHAGRIEARRETYYLRVETGEWSAAEGAARCLVMPIVDYVDAVAEGLDFVRIVSQIRSLTPADNAKHALQIRFPRPDGLTAVFEAALAELQPIEARRRIYLVVNSAFHAITEIYRPGPERTIGSGPARAAMVEQLVCMLSAFFQAPTVCNQGAAPARASRAKRAPSSRPSA